MPYIFRSLEATPKYEYKILQFLSRIAKFLNSNCIDGPTLFRIRHTFLLRLTLGCVLLLDMLLDFPVLDCVPFSLPFPLSLGL
jgi:hypothetical protein